MLYVRREGVIAQLEPFEREVVTGSAESCVFITEINGAHLHSLIRRERTANGRKFAPSVRRERGRKRRHYDKLRTCACAFDAIRWLGMSNNDQILFFEQQVKNYNIK